MLKDRNIGIIGGGMTGLCCAFYLKKLGYNPTIFEPAEKIGGLSGCFDFAGNKIEKYFHHFFSTDTELIEFLTELGLANNILWQKSRVGFYQRNRFFPFNNSVDILKLNFLSLKDRLLLGCSFLYFKFKNDYKNLENTSIADWYKKFGGQKVFDLVWRPLLISKFGEKYAEQIPASWLWGRINPRINSRQRGGERLGYLSGSLQVLMDKIEAYVGKENFIKDAVISIDDKNDKITASTARQIYYFDKIISTVPLSIFNNIYANAAENQKEEREKIEYQRVICAVLELAEPLSGYYWLNIIDKEISFAGIIEHTNLVSKKFYNNNSIVYLFNYVNSGHKLMAMSDVEIMDLYCRDLIKIFPRFEKTLIRSFVVSRDNYATPVFGFNYSVAMPKPKISDRIFLANTAQIYPHDRNVNNSIKLVKKLMQYF
jgi:protoporphyrinogen oxidase